jgi:hypothetical protein
MGGGGDFLGVEPPEGAVMMVMCLSSAKQHQSRHKKYLEQHVSVHQSLVMCLSSACKQQGHVNYCIALHSYRACVKQH